MTPLQTTKYIFILSILFIGLYLSFYFLSTTLYDVIKNDIEVDAIDEIKAEIFFSVHSTKTFGIDKTYDIDKLIDVLKTIDVRPITSNKIIGHPKLFHTYSLEFYNSHNKLSKYIRLIDKDYVSINDNYYKITNQPDLKEVYKIIILSQNEKDINDFYLEILKE